MYVPPPLPQNFVASFVSFLQMSFTTPHASIHHGRRHLANHFEPLYPERNPKTYAHLPVTARDLAGSPTAKPGDSLPHLDCCSLIFFL